MKGLRSRLNLYGIIFFTYVALVYKTKYPHPHMQQGAEYRQQRSLSHTTTKECLNGLWSNATHILLQNQEEEYFSSAPLYLGWKHRISIFLPTTIATPRWCCRSVFRPYDQTVHNFSLLLNPIQCAHLSSVDFVRCVLNSGRNCFQENVTIILVGHDPSSKM